MKRHHSIPRKLVTKMVANNWKGAMFSAVPFVGAFGYAAYKPNIRNAILLENYLLERQFSGKA